MDPVYWSFKSSPKLIHVISWNFKNIDVVKLDNGSKVDLEEFHLARYFENSYEKANKPYTKFKKCFNIISG